MSLVETNNKIYTEQPTEVLRWGKNKKLQQLWLKTIYSNDKFSQEREWRDVPDEE